MSKRETPCSVCKKPAQRGFWDPDGEGFVPVCEEHIKMLGLERSAFESQVFPIPDWYKPGQAIS